MALTKSIEPAVQNAIELLTRQGRDVNTAAILSRLHTEGLKAKASNIHDSAAWKELLAKEKGQTVPAATEQSAAKTEKPKAVSHTKEQPVAKIEKKSNFPSVSCSRRAASLWPDAGRML